MRILTVRQPWAWAIFHGGKHVENRVRNIAGDYRGAVAIHAAKEWDDAVTWNPNWETVLAAMKADGAEPFDAPWQRDRGVIIGVVDLTDVDLSDTCRKGPSWQESPGLHGLPYEGCSPWAENSVHHLVLTHARPLAEPIHYQGALGLRRLDDDTTARIFAQIGAPE